MMAPGETQDGLSTAPKRPQETLLTAKTAPRQPKIAPRRPKRRPRRPQRAPGQAHDGPKRGNMRPQEAPEMPPGPPRGPQQAPDVREAKQRPQNSPQEASNLPPKSPPYRPLGRPGLVRRRSESQVYSLRRGGCVYDFRSHGCLETTLIRGRWAHATTSRIYLQEAVAESLECNLARATLAALKAAAYALHEWAHA